MIPVDRLSPALGRAYFAAQAIAGALWWVGVFTAPWIREATLGALPAAPIAALDVPLFVIGSAVAAAGLRWAAWPVACWSALVTALLGIYATATGLAGWGVILMIAASTGSIGAAMILRLGRIPAELLLFGPFAFRPARPGDRHGRRTAAQIVVFWGLFLIVFPVIIAWLEMRWNLHLDLPIAVRGVGAVLLVAASALGIWSARTMSRLGEGTPLPSAMTNRLVVAGPYRFVRNPMALAGISQGVAVGAIMSSWLVIAYALAGSLVWNWLIRPQEESDLEARFGREFVSYRDRVRCWIPRLPTTGRTPESP